jgi:hypothetical protein
MSGTPLEPRLLLISWKLDMIPRVMTSGIVITSRIGQSAGKEPKYRFGKVYMVLPQRPHGHRQTDKLTIWSLLKIQSSPFGKPGVINETINSTRHTCFNVVWRNKDS